MYRRHNMPNWAVPAIYAAIAIAAGVTIPKIEHILFPDLNTGLSIEASLALLSSIGSGMIALTGIVFSLAFVMMQFSATAYSPRLVMSVARDPVLWHSVGIFSATFMYSIAAITMVNRYGKGTVPLLSIWIVILLLIASVGMFIALIDKLSLLQVNRMLEFTGDQGRACIGQIYPLKDEGEPDEPPMHFLGMDIGQHLRHEGAPCVIQAVDNDALLSMAGAAQGVIVVATPVGDTLVEGTVMLRVYGAKSRIDDASLGRAFVTGNERTFEQDPKYPIRLLVDIAIRALSPAVNDPTTAVQALDQIEDLLRRLSCRSLGSGAYQDKHGEPRLLLPHPTWDDFLSLSFDEIRFCGSTSVQVMRRMKALIADLIDSAPTERVASLRRHDERLDATIARAIVDPADRATASLADRQGLGSPRQELD